VVIKTPDADGFLTQAVATLPSVDVSQGIYREIADTTFYKTSVDVRVCQRAALVEHGARAFGRYLGGRTPESQNDQRCSQRRAVTSTPVISRAAVSASALVEKPR
jgi:hypothetical protein